MARELETLAVLADALPDDCSVWHAVHWTRVQRDHALVGEIDFIVVGPSGRMLLIEQKSGFLDETEHGLVKSYPRKSKNVSVQMARNADHLRARLQTYLAGRPCRLDSVLYCPDYTVRQPGTAGVDPARIVDASQRSGLAHLVHALVRDDVADPAMVKDVERFLADELELVPEVNAMVGQAEALYTRLSGGLTEWARRIEMQPFRLRVTGTAGSGKTQLALAVFRDAIEAGRRPLYVCYNRPLADHILLITPRGGEVATYHQLCVRMVRDAGHQPDFSRPGAFGEVERTAASLTPPERWRFDEIIIDEGQDFREGWRDHLLGLLKENGRVWWMEDPMQNLYDRPPVALPGWVGLSSHRNYRSPADIVETLNQMLNLPETVEPGSPLTGSGLEMLTWDDARSLLDATKRAITRAIGLGFKRQHIALVTFRGREHSAFTPFDRLGPHSLRAFTGRYDLLGNPEFTEGDVLIDSVHRFKGQAAPCVIFTEIDFETLDELTLRKLFVGATRASMKLIMVVSARAAKMLARTGDVDQT